MWDVLGGRQGRRGTGAPVKAAIEDGAAWVEEHLGWKPDETQERVLRTERKRVLLNCTRQWGKSTVTAAKAVMQATREAGSLTLVVSPSARQSGEFLRKAAGFARKLRVRPKGDGDNEISLAFPNGSRIVGLPGNEATVRGFSAVSLLLVDEAARVNDELYLAMRPMLAVSSRGVVADEHAVREAGLFLGGVGRGRAGVGAGTGTGDGMPADCAGVSGRRAGDDGGAVVPAGVPVRIRGDGGAGCSSGTWWRRR